ncbi:MAG: choice-of-anchor F family protein [Phycisphaeraceae bacterium]|nr:MAG: choice-of-anchor F family protein [Phycisphaeraceae bacterium]
MSTKNHAVGVVVCASAGILLASSATPANAAEIVGLTWFSGVGSVAGETIVPPVDPNNDDVVGLSPNQIFILQKNYQAIGPVDLVFHLIDSGGTTEYAFIEGVSNGTGIDWNGYRLELGFGVGDDFVKSTSGDGLSFDAPDYNSPFTFPAFSTVSVTEHDVTASGGIIPAFAYASGIVFHIDVPDGISSFTLRQSPLPVPAPGTGLVGALALLVATPRRRR